MLSVLKYNSYRDYIREHLEHEKKSSPLANWTEYAKKFAMSAASLNLILSGKRNLTVANLNKIARVFRFSQHEHEYFEALVHRDQSDDPASRNYYNSKLRRLKGAKSTKRLRVADKVLLSGWFVPVLLIYLIDFEKARDLDSIDYKKLALRFNQPEKELQRLVMSFEKQGLLNIDPQDGIHIAFDRVASKLPQKEHVRSVFREMERCLDNQFASSDTFFRALVFTLERARVEEFKSDLMAVMDKYISAPAKEASESLLMQGCLGFYPVV
jgi:uncharacterized protein (TIGR02147 family)